MKKTIISISFVLLITSLGIAGVSSIATVPDIEWTFTAEYLQSSVGQLNDIYQTADSGYCSIGYIQNTLTSERDFLVIRLSISGDTIWTRTYDFDFWESAEATIEMHDGSFLIAGGSGPSAHDQSWMILKLDPTGNIIWTKQYSWRSEDIAYDLKLTKDSNVIVSGKLGPLGAGNWDAVLMKIDRNGDSLWTATYGGTGNEYAYSVQEMSQGGFVLTGSESSGGGTRMYLVTTDALGNKMWDRSYGGGEDYGRCVVQTYDNGFILSGYTHAMGAGLMDQYLVKTDANGDTLWTRTYGGTGNDKAYSVFETRDSAFVISGFMQIASTVRTAVAKIDRSGNTIWSLTDSIIGPDESIYGSCLTNDGGIALVGHLGVNASVVKLTALPSVITEVFIDGAEGALHILDHTPEISWSYFDHYSRLQTMVEIEVGSDSDWTTAEMWSSGPLLTTDTFVVYAGSPLLDGQTYYTRIRIDNSVVWSEWLQTSFRMNSIPSVPSPLQPDGGIIVETNQPTLWVTNSSDAEGDVLQYEYQLSLAGSQSYSSSGLLDEQIDSTGWYIGPDIALWDNFQYLWQVRSFDEYEYSDWSEIDTAGFWVNATPEAPTAPQAIYPPDTGATNIVFDMLPTFTWSASTDPDPLDSVHYRLEIAVDSNFTFVQVVDSLSLLSHSLSDSLTFNTQYWWRVTAIDNTGLSTVSATIPDFWTWTLGDLDQTHEVNVSDLTMLVAYLFQGGPEPQPSFINDIDGNCELNVSDLTYLVAYLFQGGATPAIGCAP